MTPTFPADAIPGMNPPEVYRSLTHLAMMMGNGDAVAVQIGVWLGASTRAIADGFRLAGMTPEIHMFDRWRANRSEVEKACAQGLTIKEGEDLLPLAAHHIQWPCMAPHRGDVRKATWDGRPIGLMVFDQAKRDPGWSHALRTFGPAWRPGTLLALLDLHFWQSERFANNPDEREAYYVQQRWVDDQLERGKIERLSHLDAGSAGFFRVLSP